MTETSPRQRDAEWLGRIRRQVAAIQPGEWLHSADDQGQLLEARGPHGELTPVCRFDPIATHAEIRFVADAPSNVPFLLELVDRAIADKRAQMPPPQDRYPKDYAAEAAMKCAEPAFRVFLEERHGLERPLTPERVAQRLRSVLAVKSRRELNDDAAAAQRWCSLRADYETWKRSGR